MTVTESAANENQLMERENTSIRYLSPETLKLILVAYNDFWRTLWPFEPP